MLGADSATSTSRANKVNAANCADKALLVSENSEVWIIDTGAANPMVSNLTRLLKGSIVKTKNPKEVQLRNGEMVQVTHLGSCALSANSVITNVFHIPQFKYNLLSVSRIIKELGYSVTFFPHFCVFQELNSGEVKKIGEEGGLYWLLKHLTTTEGEQLSTFSVKDV